jgi:hypothetical protein
MKGRWPLVIGGCVGLFVVCCVLSFAVLFVAGGSIQDQIAGMFNQTPGQLPPGIETAVPSGLPSGLPTLPAKGSNPAPTQPPSASTSGNPFADALSKGATASKYRVRFSWIFGGMQNGKYTEQPFFDFTGEVDGKNTHLVSKGGFLAMLGGDNSTIEIIDADGKEYMKGITMFGMTDPKVWYIQKDASTSSGFSDFTKPNYFSDFTGGDKAGYQKVGSESVDGQPCEVYLYDMKSLQNAALVGLLGSAQDKSDFSAIDKAEMKVWLCRDGYVHQFTMDYEGHSQNDVNSKGAMKMNIHLWDFNNSAISVQAPANAKPMPQ